ncbi:hypothetical protein [Litorimonas haliclonae]|uniref:hypothetical protein n=1 Tax=Litorimonas haliclonae TaxID=2081977 RepID=UPI0039F11CCA
MNSDPLTPITDRAPAKRDTAQCPARGRPADLVACGIASCAALSAAITSILFFLGFAANDSVLAGLVSAFAFAVLLGAFAVVPAVITAMLAWRGWKAGLRRKNAVWVVLLMAPWTALSVIALLNAPLSKILSGGAFLASTLLLLWAIISLILGPGRNFGAK